MRKNFNLKLLIINLGLISLFIIPEYAVATFDISVRPYEGGYDLRFGKINTVVSGINKEVVVNITSDIGKQYRLIQTIVEPLTNAQGIPIPQNNFFVYGIRGTNKYGTLALEQEIPVFYGRTVIYTSNSEGLSDSFTLVYGIKGSLDVATGSYRGRISYSLEPIDAAQSSVTAILNVLVEIEAESAIEIKTSTGRKVISLNSRREEVKACDVLVSIKGGYSGQFRILQLIPESLVSTEANLLPYEAINFMVKEVKKGIGPNTLTVLSAAQQVIYTSSPNGEAEDFVITYSLGNIEKQKCGNYKMVIKYYLEGPSSFLIDTLSLEIANERIFDLVVSPDMGGMMQFLNLKPLEPPRMSLVNIEIKTNVGRPYQVSQKIIQEFTDKEGNIIPQEYFNLRTEPLETKGRLRFLDKTQVEKGGMILFVSDKEGSSDSFKIIYELAIPLDIKPGDYSTTLVYSITEI